MTKASRFAKRYLDALTGVLGRLPLAALDRIAARLEEAHAAGRQIFIVGNGGSAATASHLMNDLNKFTLGYKGDGPWRRFRAVALTDNVPLLTAWANDTSYARIFSEPLKNLARPGDVLLCLSVSGRSPNILAAARTAKAMGLTVLGFSGAAGTKFAGLCETCVVVPATGYGPVEDVHLILGHILTLHLYEKLKAAHAARR